MGRKILFVGEEVPGSRSLQRLNALRALGHKVLFIPTTPPGHSCETQPNLWHRICYRLRLPLDRARTNRTLVGLFSASFDIVWLDNASIVRPSTLAHLTAANPRLLLVWFSEDDMMNPRHRSRWIEASIPRFDLWVTTKSFNAELQELPALGAQKVLFVHNAYDRDLHQPLEISEDDQRRFGAEVAFVGTFEQPRSRSLLALAQAGVKCRVWGNGWSGMIGAHPNLIIENRPVYGMDYNRVLAATAINLCFLRHFNRDRQTTRSIEIPACGAFMLHESSEELSSLLRPGVEAAYFANDDELISACRYWLANVTARRAVAAAALQRVRALGLSHHETVSRILVAAEGRS